MATAENDGKLLFMNRDGRRFEISNKKLRNELRSEWGNFIAIMMTFFCVEFWEFRFSSSSLSSRIRGGRSET